MRCPKCKKEGCKYIEPRQRSTIDSKDPIERTNFLAKCNKCDFSDIV